jgi:hypothetical protein
VKWLKFIVEPACQEMSSSGIRRATCIAQNGKEAPRKIYLPRIITGLRDMNFLELKGEGYVPTYTRTDFTDALHEAFGFRTDFTHFQRNTKSCKVFNFQA